MFNSCSEQVKNTSMIILFSCPDIYTIINFEKVMKKFLLSLMCPLSS